MGHRDVDSNEGGKGSHWSTHGSLIIMRRYSWGPRPHAFQQAWGGVADQKVWPMVWILIPRYRLGSSEKSKDIRWKPSAPFPLWMGWAWRYYHPTFYSVCLKTFGATRLDAKGLETNPRFERNDWVALQGLISDLTRLYNLEVVGQHLWYPVVPMNPAPESSQAGETVSDQGMPTHQCLGPRAIHFKGRNAAGLRELEMPV